MRNGSLGIHFTRRGFAVELSVEKKSDGNEEKSPPTFFPFYLPLPLVNDGGKRQSSTFEPLLLLFLAEIPSAKEGTRQGERPGKEGRGAGTDRFRQRSRQQAVGVSTSSALRHFSDLSFQLG